MKKKDGFILHHIDREHILIPDSMEEIDFTRLIAFNDTASWLWESLDQKSFNAPDLAELLTSEYDVAPAVALQDAHRLLAQWENAGIISE